MGRSLSLPFCLWLIIMYTSFAGDKDTKDNLMSKYEGDCREDRVNRIW